MFLVGIAGAASADEVRFEATLSGANEAGDAGGDSDGFGQAAVSIDTVTSEVCFEITVSGTEAPAAAHIHVGGAGSNGDVVVNFDWSNTNGSGCVAADPSTLAAIVTNPSLYYVNVHTADFPAGAVRGQLAMSTAAASVPSSGGSDLAFTGSGLTPILAVAGAAMIAGGVIMVSAGRRRRD
jgi:hypothetical protein